MVHRQRLGSTSGCAAESLPRKGVWGTAPFLFESEGTCPLSSLAWIQAAFGEGLGHSLTSTSFTGHFSPSFLSSACQIASSQRSWARSAWTSSLCLTSAAKSVDSTAGPFPSCLSFVPPDVSSFIAFVIFLSRIVGSSREIWGFCLKASSLSSLRTSLGQCLGWPCVLSWSCPGALWVICSSQASCDGVLRSSGGQSRLLYWVAHFCSIANHCFLLYLATSFSTLLSWIWQKFT